MKHLLRSAVWIILVAGLALSFSACGASKVPEAPVKTEATLGETVQTRFFDFSVARAERVAQYADYSAKDDKELVCASVTVLNSTQAPVTLFDSDFTLSWGAGPEAFAWVVDAFADGMQPAQDTLAAGEMRSYDLLFLVPRGQTDFVVCYTEAYENEQGESMNGNAFRVSFALTAEE